MKVTLIVDVPLSFYVLSLYTIVMRSSCRNRKEDSRDARKCRVRFQPQTCRHLSTWITRQVQRMPLCGGTCFFLEKKPRYQYLALCVYQLNCAGRDRGCLGGPASVGYSTCVRADNFEWLLRSRVGNLIPLWGEESIPGTESGIE